MNLEARLNGFLEKLNKENVVRINLANGLILRSKRDAKDSSVSNVLELNDDPNNTILLNISGSPLTENDLQPQGPSQAQVSSSPNDRLKFLRSLNDHMTTERMEVAEKLINDAKRQDLVLRSNFDELYGKLRYLGYGDLSQKSLWIYSWIGNLTSFSQSRHAMSTELEKYVKRQIAWDIIEMASEKIRDEIKSDREILSDHNMIVNKAQLLKIESFYRITAQTANREYRRATRLVNSALALYTHISNSDINRIQGISQSISGKLYHE
jgi:hypothetical protein